MGITCSKHSPVLSSSESEVAEVTASAVETGSGTTTSCTPTTFNKAEPLAHDNIPPAVKSVASSSRSGIRSERPSTASPGSPAKQIGSVQSELSFGAGVYHSDPPDTEWVMLYTDSSETSSASPELGTTAPLHAVKGHPATLKSHPSRAAPKRSAFDTGARATKPVDTDPVRSSNKGSAFHETEPTMTTMLTSELDKASRLARSSISRSSSSSIFDHANKLCNAINTMPVKPCITEIEPAPLLKSIWTVPASVPLANNAGHSPGPRHGSPPRSPGAAAPTAHCIVTHAPAAVPVFTLPSGPGASYRRMPARSSRTPSPAPSAPSTRSNPGSTRSAPTVLPLPPPPGFMPVPPPCPNLSKEAAAVLGIAPQSGRPRREHRARRTQRVSPNHSTHQSPPHHSPVMPYTWQAGPYNQPMQYMWPAVPVGTARGAHRYPYVQRQRVNGVSPNRQSRARQNGSRAQGQQMAQQGGYEAGRNFLPRNLSHPSLPKLQIKPVQRHTSEAATTRSPDRPPSASPSRTHASNSRSPAASHRSPEAPSRIPPRRRSFKDVRQLHGHWDAADHSGARPTGRRTQAAPAQPTRTGRSTPSPTPSSHASTTMHSSGAPRPSRARGFNSPSPVSQTVRPTARHADGRGSRCTPDVHIEAELDPAAAAAAALAALKSPSSLWSLEDDSDIDGLMRGVRSFLRAAQSVMSTSDGHTHSLVQSLVQPAEGDEGPSVPSRGEVGMRCRATKARAICEDRSDLKSTHSAPSTFEFSPAVADDDDLVLGWRLPRNVASSERGTSLRERTSVSAKADRDWGRPRSEPTTSRGARSDWEALFGRSLRDYEGELSLPHLLSPSFTSIPHHEPQHRSASPTIHRSVSPPRSPKRFASGEFVPDTHSQQGTDHSAIGSAWSSNFRLDSHAARASAAGSATSHLSSDMGGSTAGDRVLEPSSGHMVPADARGALEPAAKRTRVPEAPSTAYGAQKKNVYQHAWPNKQARWRG